MNIILNGVVVDIFEYWVVDMFLYVFWEYFGLVGVKFGCGVGVCGVCVVIVDGEVMWFCVLLVSVLENVEV